MDNIRMLKNELDNIKKREKEIHELIRVKGQKKAFENLVKGNYYVIKEDSYLASEYIVKFDPEKVRIESAGISDGSYLIFETNVFIQADRFIEYRPYRNEPIKTYICDNEITVKPLNIEEFKKELRKIITKF